MDRAMDEEQKTFIDSLTQTGGPEGVKKWQKQNVPKAKL
jgi:hypothetical protein